MLSNAETKLLRDVASSRHMRKKQPVFIAEGLRLCQEAVCRQPAWCIFLLATDAFLQQPAARPLLDSARAAGIRVESLPEGDFNALCQTETPQGVLCLLRRPDFKPPTALPTPFALILDRVAEPGNFGTILRTAWAVGLHEIWLVKGGADPYAPKVVRSGMGAQFALSFAQFDSLEQAAETLHVLGGTILWVTEEHADVSVFDETAFTLRGNGLVIGNEANGIDNPALGRPVTIPMPGNAESLNVAQATTVFLFEAVRRGLL